MCRTGLASLLVLTVNDHVLKPVFHDGLTGKLSDIAGLVFLPLLVMALAEMLTSLVSSSWVIGRRASGIILTCIAIGFSSVKTSLLVGRLYGTSLGPSYRLLLHVLAGSTASRHGTVRVLSDPTDLIALPALIVPWLIARRRFVAATTSQPEV